MPKRVTSFLGPSPRNCARATQLLSKKCRSGGELLATLSQQLVKFILIKMRVCVCHSAGAPGWVPWVFSQQISQDVLDIFPLLEVWAEQIWKSAGVARLKLTAAGTMRPRPISRAFIKKVLFCSIEKNRFTLIYLLWRFTDWFTSCDVLGFFFAYFNFLATCLCFSFSNVSFGYRIFSPTTNFSSPRILVGRVRQIR